jgi:hypothetical protein
MSVRQEAMPGRSRLEAERPLSGIVQMATSGIASSRAAQYFGHFWGEANMSKLRARPSLTRMDGTNPGRFASVSDLARHGERWYQRKLEINY